MGISLRRGGTREVAYSNLVAFLNRIVISTAKIYAKIGCSFEFPESNKVNVSERGGGGVKKINPKNSIFLSIRELISSFPLSLKRKIK